ncbi:hypothetical protein Dsui_0908 [Azospira oryzae PS]|uniref:Uncharacterized protein n=1 Tax=Azospira oryzae (strain ATCC BAA-33 / DSM 13638 / PS) TaxID=640081 RepID=G8QIF4_AZOOP|nr:hypothetical protein Dsui_0908 [Azospira oryzae PS]
MLDRAAARHCDTPVSEDTNEAAVPSKQLPEGHHFHLKNGDHHAELNKTIQDLVLSTDSYFVYVASDHSIQWSTTDEHQAPEYFGEILSRVAILEARSGFIEDPNTLGNIRRQIAEGLARCLGNHRKSDCFALLDEVDRLLAARNKETAWKWYFTAAYKVTGACAVGLVLLWLARAYAVSFIGRAAFEVSLGILCGAIGALLSVTTRASRIVMDANAGQQIHQLEGLSRIGAGLIGALFVALSFQGGLIMGGVQFPGSRLAMMLAFCIAAGASERLVPSLVDKIERSALSADRH